ncbi:MAG TPA: hypothetical protein PLU35_12315 [Phycisphaerales bacterium]|nr:hypothetical protein [Phycisphaerales bacterium]
MGDAFRKVRSGQPLAIPAAAYNAFIDAAIAARQRNAGVAGVSRSFRQAGVMPVLNASGEPRARYDVLGLSSPIVMPTDDPDGFAERVAMRGVTPASEHAGAFAVLLAPASAGSIAPAVVDGACIARVRVLDESDRYAEVDPPSSARLRSAPSGSARILWLQPPGERDDPEIAWAVVRIGVGSPIAVGRITAVSAPGPAPASTVTYDGEAEGLAFSAQAPLFRPFDGLPVVNPAAVGSTCIVHVYEDTSGVAVRLLMCAEALVHAVCPEPA